MTIHRLLLFLLTLATATAIGVNFGNVADNLPSPSAIANFVQTKTTIDAVKLFDADPNIITAFAGTGISLMITLPNNLIVPLADPNSGVSTASSWIASNVSPFVPRTKISLIGVGNEVTITSDAATVAALVKAMENVHAALQSDGLPQIRVTTPNSLAILSGNDFPSSARFSDESVFVPMLDFHRRTKTPFMVNPYPYFGLMGNVSKLNYALFRPNAGVLDPATKIRYSSMFVGQLDAVYTAMKRVGYADVEIAVGETGWPTAGWAGQLGVSPQDAQWYNKNLLEVVQGGKGTPLMPRRKFETFIFELFDEDLKWGAPQEKHWGLFKADMSPAYDIGLLRAGQTSGGTSGGSSVPKKWCVANSNSSPTILQNNIDYACSQKGVDCNPIQPSGACYNPNTLLDHASYAMNAYYQAYGRNDNCCNFANTGVIITTNPSTGQCQYQS